MKFKIKKIDINAGALVCYLNEKDADKLDLNEHDRVKISKGKKFVTCILNVCTEKTLKSGNVGLLEEAYDELEMKSGSLVDISHVEKPMSLHYIKEKLKGKRLSYEKIYAIIKDIVDGNFSHIEMTYFVSACYVHELSMDEVVSLTRAMIDTGEVLKLPADKILDKHCIGGVAGNRTTMVVVPIIAALGYTMPKTSSRSITSPAGTADTFEVLCPVSYEMKEIKKIVKKTNGCIVWGGAVNMAPADDKIIKVEHPVSLDPTGQLLASILAKKKSVSATHLLIDIPYGKGAKIENINDALDLKKKFLIVSKKLGMKTKVVLTDGKEPVGHGVGPVLEARDVLWLFERDERRPKDLEEKALHMAAELVKLASGKSLKESYKECKEVLDSGIAHHKLEQIIKAQKGTITNSKQIKLSKITKDIIAKKSGTVKHVDNKKISRIAKMCGAPLSKKAGLFLNFHVGDKVKKGDILMTLYAESKDRLDAAYKFHSKVGAIDLK